MSEYSINKKILNLLLKGSQAQRIELCRRERLYFAIYYFPEYFVYAIPPFHFEFYSDLKDLMNGTIDELVWKGHRESAKTSIPKIALVAHAICYGLKEYINWDSYDKANSEQALFDITVSLQTNKRIIEDFGHLFNKKSAAGEMSEAKMKRVNNFITENGIKVEAFSTQQSVRGRLYKNKRPDLIVVEDFETSKTKDSYAMTHAVVKHIDEMRSGITNCAVIYLCNYITEDGSVAYVVNAVKNNPKGRVREVPLINKRGEVSWPAKYAKTDLEAAERNKGILDPRKRVISIESLKKKLGNSAFEAEMQLNPAHSGDKVFDRNAIEELIKNVRDPIHIKGGLKIWAEYRPDHRYVNGADTAKGIGRDSNASAIIDLSTIPNKVIATYKNNTIAPDVFAHELKRQGEMYGTCLISPESNNTGYATINELKRIYDNKKIYLPLKDEKVKTPVADEYGFDTNRATKPEAIYQLKRAVEDGLLLIFDIDVLEELKRYSMKDLDTHSLVDGMTHHFDLLMAIAIAWATRNHAKISTTNVRKHTQSQLPPIAGQYGG